MNYIFSVGLKEFVGPRGPRWLKPDTPDWHEHKSQHRHVQFHRHICVHRELEEAEVSEDYEELERVRLDLFVAALHYLADMQ